MSKVQAGDSVAREPEAITGVESKRLGRMRGTVVWVHPLERFHVVEFQTRGGPLRECFRGVSREC